MGAGVTRPGGVTPRGFPYPGSAGIQATTPGALQALAEAITGQLSSIGAGVILDVFVGARTVSANTVQPLTVAEFPKLASITGMVAQIGSAPGASYLGGGVNTGGTAPQQTFRVMALRNRAPAYTGNITVLAIAWGPAK